MIDLVEKFEKKIYKKSIDKKEKKNKRYWIQRQITREVYNEDFV